MNIKKIDQAVFATTDDMIKIDGSTVDLLRSEAQESLRQRVRFNAHDGPAALVHEMIIALAHDTYIAPHKHFSKPESFHIIEGQLDIVIFNDDGVIREIVGMGDYASGKIFYYRNASPMFHAVVVRSRVVIFQETTQGPFVKEHTVFAPWAPSVEGPEAAAYLLALRRDIEAVSGQG